MGTVIGHIPPGPADNFDSAEDLLSWMQRHVARHGDIFQARVYGSHVYVISSPEYAQHVLLNNWQNYWRKGQAVKRIALSLGNGLISSNGPFWVNQRRMIQPAFRREAIGALLNVFAKPNIALRDKWKQAACSASSVNVTRDVSLTVLEVTLRAIFGDDYDTVAPSFQVIADESRDLHFAETCVSLAGLIVQIASHRRSARIDADDILGAMLRARAREDGRPMADKQLAREAMTLVIAGHETTASVLNWIWYLLARHPECEAKLGREISQLLGDELPGCEALARFDYTRRVINEALRTYPPLWLITRKAQQDDELGGYRVPAGTEIYISPYIIQRHPQLWQEPERFDPERFGAEESPQRHPLAMCPFGAGPRNCIGEFFARAEMQVHLLLIAKELRMRYDKPEPAEFAAGVNLLSRDHFVMKPQLKSVGAVRICASPAELTAQVATPTAATVA